MKTTRTYVDARCPVCGQWAEIEQSFLGQPQNCFNCHQMSIPVPRTARAIFWRKVIKLGFGLLIVWWFFSAFLSWLSH